MDLEILGNLNFYDEENNEQYNFDIEIQNNVLSIFYNGEMINDTNELLEIINKNKNVNENSIQELLNNFEKINNLTLENY